MSTTKELIKNNSIFKMIDFVDFPLLYIEEDKVGTKYLSYYLEELSDNQEIRIITAVSPNRLNEILSGNISIQQSYKFAEQGILFLEKINSFTNEIISVEEKSVNEFDGYNKIDSDYILNENIDLLIEDNQDSIFKLTRQKHKIILDLYIQGDALRDSVKLWTFNNIINPLIYIIKDILNDTDNKLDNLIGLSNFRQHSLGTSLEIPYDNIGLLENEVDYERIKNLSELIFSTEEENLVQLMTYFKKDKTLEEYHKIINTVISKDLKIDTKLASPTTERLITTNINKDNAQKIRDLLLARAEDQIDIEIVNGVFVNLILSQKVPSFGIKLEDNLEDLKGSIAVELIKKISEDEINFLTTIYEFTIKTIIKPSTPFRDQEIIRLLIDYRNTGIVPTPTQTEMNQLTL